MYEIIISVKYKKTLFQYVRIIYVSNEINTITLINKKI